MKNLFTVIAMILGLSISAQAGDMKFTCKNADGSILITRSKLVLLSKDDTQQYNLTVLNNLSFNTMPEKNEVMEFESESNDGNIVGELKITSVSRRKIIANDDGRECYGGHGPGFSTEAYKVRGRFSTFGEKAKTVELSCVESSYWSGNCANGEE
jgi:hypothetical protein